MMTVICVVGGLGFDGGMDFDWTSNGGVGLDVV